MSAHKKKTRTPTTTEPEKPARVVLSLSLPGALVKRLDAYRDTFTGPVPKRGALALWLIGRGLDVEERPEASS